MKLKVHVCNDKMERTFCRISLHKLSKGTVDDKQSTFYCDGEYEFELEPGEYHFEFHKGQLYHPVHKQMVIDDMDVVVEVVLTELIDTKRMGLYSFDAHSHVSRNLKLKTGNLENASMIMKGEDFNFFFAGSPYDQETHIQNINNQYDDEVTFREKYAERIHAINSESFIVDIGNEIVKCRFGHMFLMNHEQAPPYSKYYDSTWDPWLFTKVGEEPEYCIPYPYEALGKEKGKNSAAVAAHPTSWWHHQSEFISNIAATIGFEILAESIDAMVIMGYDSDHVHYQRLWYDALNNGYFMPGVAETDHTFDTNSQKHLVFKTYTFLDEFGIEELCSSVKAGRNLVSSGPILLLKVNDQRPGSVMNYAEDEMFDIHIEAMRCYQAALCHIQLIVNGEVWKEYKINEDRYNLKEKLTVNQDSYILAKCYDSAGNVAITNPVYIRNKPFENRGFESEVTVKVTQDGKRVNGRFWIDDNISKVTFSEEFQCNIKVTSEVNIEVGGIVKKIKLFELDELQHIFKNLYFGYFNSNNRYAPGEVPAEYFELSRIKKILKKVDLEISF